MNTFKLFFLSFLFSTTTYAQGIVSTIAGTGIAGYNGDNVAATTVQLAVQTGKAVVDHQGNVYIADRTRIRRVDRQTGIITTICGDGTQGSGGDGGPAVNAQAGDVLCIAINNAGDLFLPGGSRIRKIDHATGIITTIAGTGVPGFSGDGGPALSAQMSGVMFIALDNDENILLADINRIRKIDAVTGIINTIAGTGVNGNGGNGGLATAATITPAAMCVDSADNIVFLDADDMTMEYEVRKIDAATNIIDHYAGTNIPGFSGDGGPSTLAQIGICSDIAADKLGNVFVADHQVAFRIRKIDAAGIITTVAGNGTLQYNGDGTAPLVTAIDPGSVSLDSCGNLYITDITHPRIRRVTYEDCYPIQVVSVQGPEKENRVVKLYPNPAATELSISFSEKFSGIAIVDLTGRIVLEQPVNSDQVTVDVSGLSSGIYFVRVGEQVVKFTKE